MGDILMRIMGITDVAAAIILALMHIPIISYFKWVIVMILAIKGFSSLVA
jgi:hypothetical protein